jgi:hypothetical protein
MQKASDIAKKLDLRRIEEKHEEDIYCRLWRDAR